MAEVVASIKRVTDIMGEITAASEEQSSGIEQINHAVVQMDQVTQQNAALVEEAAAAAESMQEQAQQLANVVAVFKMDGARVSNSSRATGVTRCRAAGLEHSIRKPAEQAKVERKAFAKTGTDDE